jgi:peptidylprolyl isomerase
MTHVSNGETGMRFAILGMTAMALSACGASDTPSEDITAGDEIAADISTQTQASVSEPDFSDINDWRPVDPEDLLLIETARGMVAVELSDDFAPNHTARIRQAVRDGFFDGREFYRVIDGFVAQGGRGEEADSIELPQYPTLTGEFFVDSSSIEFTPMIDNDLYAPVVGHVGGFPAAQNEDRSETWLLHCPGTMALARDNGPDTGDIEFYIVIGQGPRYLDRIMTVFGRVIDGMQHVQALNRGDPSVNYGVIVDPADRDPIVSMHISADLPAEDQLAYEIMDTRGQAFHDAKNARRNRTHEFFFQTPPAVIEACHMPARARIVGSEDTE